MNNKANTTTLIESLCDDLAPVSILRKPSHRGFLWLAFCFFVSLALVFITGDFRSGFQQQLLQSPRFCIETAVGFASGIIAAFYAFEMSVPGSACGFKQKLLSVSPFIVFTVMTVYSLFNPAIAPSWSGWRSGCEFEIILFGIFPMLVFLLLIEKAAPIKSKWVGMLVGIASVAPSVALMQLACMYNPAHALGYHIAPVILVGLVGAYVGGRIFKV